MVDPECQREGIGLSLVESVLDYVESLGIQCLHVTFQDHLEEF
jgi:N-acetylglutamate synthase-like GNAT family acetyltransferase